MKKLYDLNWTLAPLVSFLNTMGGWTLRTLIRRVGIAVFVTLYAFLYYRFLNKRNIFIYPILLVSVFASFTLPLTLIGDSLHTHWFNWVWIYCLGFVMSLGLLPIIFLCKSSISYGRNTFFRFFKWATGAALLVLASGIPVMLSNMFGWPVHKWCEIILGLTYGGVASWLIGSEE